MNFDHDKVYYQVIQIRAGYEADAEATRIIAEESGFLHSDRPVFEFESLEGIGAWLFLGSSIRRLKIPRGAEVILNSPTGQGNCYRYSSDSVELLEIIDITELLNEMTALQDVQLILNIADYKIPDGFVFPPGTFALHLNRCHLPSRFTWPVNTTMFSLADCTTDRFSIVPPASLSNISIAGGDLFDCDIRIENRGRLHLSRSLLTDLMIIGNAESVSFHDCNLKDVYLQGKIDAAMFHKTSLQGVEFPEKMGRVSFINCSIGEQNTFPKVVSTDSAIVDCDFASVETVKSLSNRFKISGHAD